MHSYVIFRVLKKAYQTYLKAPSVTAWHNLARLQRELPAAARAELCWVDRPFSPVPDFTSIEKLPRDYTLFDNEEALPYKLDAGAVLIRGILGAGAPAGFGKAMYINDYGLEIYHGIQNKSQLINYDYIRYDLEALTKLFQIRTLELTQKKFQLAKTFQSFGYAF